MVYFSLEEEEDIVKRMNSSSEDPEHEDVPNEEEIVVTNYHLLQKLLQNHKLLVNIQTKQEELTHLCKNEGKQLTNDLTTLAKGSKKFTKPVITIV